MNTTVGVYDTHEKAIQAVEQLKCAGFPVEQVSLIGTAVVVDDLIHVRHNTWIKNAPAIIGAIAGPVLGILIGLKIVGIPGLGFLYGAGVFTGALVGFSLGLVGGGCITLLATLAIKSRTILKYHERIVEKGFQVVAHGNIEEINKAKEILESQKKPIEFKSQ